MKRSRRKVILYLLAVIAAVYSLAPIYNLARSRSWTPSLWWQASSIPPIPTSGITCVSSAIR